MLCLRLVSDAYPSGVQDHEPFDSNLRGWRRDVLHVARALTLTGGLVLMLIVVLVALFGGGSVGAARTGAFSLLLLLLSAPLCALPVAVWSDWTAIRKDDHISVETFLRGRRVLRVTQVCRVATRMIQGRAGTGYYAAIWDTARRSPTVVLTWGDSDSPTRDLVRDLASDPAVRCSARALVHLDLPGAPRLARRILLASRTVALGAVYVAAVGCLAWEYAYLLGGESTPIPFRA